MHIFKNFIFVLKRFKTSSLLNLMGLTVAFAAFYIIITQVHYEYTFENCHSKADRIYRLDRSDKSGDLWSIHSRPLANTAINSIAHVETGTIINPYIGEFYFTTNTNGKEQGHIENFLTCEADITKIFDFSMIEGNSNCLSEPQNILIPESMAKRLFGDGSVLGKAITLSGYLWSKQNGGELYVGGVYKDFPNNTQLNNYIYTAIKKDFSMNDPSSSNFFCFLLLDDQTNVDLVEKSLNTIIDLSIYYGEEDVNDQEASMQLTPLKSIYFLNEAPNSNLIKSGNPTTPVILLAIAFLIILIAVINYMNFNLALAPRRLRSINTQKILGCPNSTLRVNIVSEAIIMSLLAYILAIGLIWITNDTNFLSFITPNLDFEENLFSISLTLAVAIITGILAGLRPAFFITSYSPALAIKGGGNNTKASKLRLALIGIQFLISITLIISSIFIYLQNEFILQYNLGYDTEQVAVVKISQKLESDVNTYVNSLKNNPDIEDIAFCSEHFGASDSYRMWGGRYKDINIPLYSVNVSHNFFDVLNIKAIDGRIPSESDEGGKMQFVINKVLHDKYGVIPGENINISWMEEEGRTEVMGIVGDVKFRSLRNENSNLVFTINERNISDRYFSYIKIRAGANIPKTVEYIERTISKLDPAYPTKVTFYDEVFDRLYKREINTQSIISLFSILAILLSISGVFGLVMFESQQRQKEISVRKVFGSTISEILILFNKLYVRIFLISFVIAIPISYYMINKWLENFAYKTPIHWWVFLASGLLILLIVLFTVTLQSYKAATANPVNSLKSE